MNPVTIIHRLIRKVTVILDSKWRLPPIDLNKPSLFVFSVSTQINYGDLAILLAQEKFCQEFLPEYNYVEILDYQIKSGLRGVKSMIKDNDVIVDVS